MEPTSRPIAVILCIDDQPACVRVRALVLESEGYCVLSASNAEEGLKLFRENPIDLVISDHLLSSMTGTQMAAEMKREKPSIPIIILSGVTEIPEGVEHADLFLRKSETPVEVLRQISGLLKRSKVGHTAS